MTRQNGKTSYKLEIRHLLAITTLSCRCILSTRPSEAGWKAVVLVLWVRIVLELGAIHSQQCLWKVVVLVLWVPQNLVRAWDHSLLKCAPLFVLITSGNDMKSERESFRYGEQTRKP
ncbi:hypothetical protein AVEN_161347-1 [Araneus ventricosus]|uniref:Uncharacterized protein n=1 Tax=Araneus ventricosus TaxID=182803 RepID=A0A4Y2Q5E8_ARAVE|nr:hypothetical protein AVEN_161347-1 [Araneus ventricosus]